MSDHDYLIGGWKRKYTITKADGSPVDPMAIYFVLRLDEDPCARSALAAYANAVGAAGNDEFERELKFLLRELRERDPTKCIVGVFGDPLDAYRYGPFEDEEAEDG